MIGMTDGLYVEVPGNDDAKADNDTHAVCSRLIFA